MNLSLAKSLNVNKPSHNSVGGEEDELRLSLAEGIKHGTGKSMCVAGPSFRSEGGDETEIRLSLAEHSQEKGISQTAEKMLIKVLVKTRI